MPLLNIDDTQPSSRQADLRMMVAQLTTVKQAAPVRPAMRNRCRHSLQERLVLKTGKAYDSAHRHFPSYRTKTSERTDGSLTELLRYMHGYETKNMPSLLSKTAGTTKGEAVARFLSRAHGAAIDGVSGQRVGLPVERVIANVLKANFVDFGRPLLALIQTVREIEQPSNVVADISIGVNDSRRHT